LFSFAQTSPVMGGAGGTGEANARTGVSPTCHQSPTVDLGSEASFPSQQCPALPWSLHEMAIATWAAVQGKCPSLGALGRGTGKCSLPLSLLQVMKMAKKRPSSWQSFTPATSLLPLGRERSLLKSWLLVQIRK